ncbi:CLUMA_CG008420, isoform A [Clunio marinus]|uniref:Alkylglycerone-phosphate synthase n=1 Tax=Clunio marinus TaxID=568069 RepID=A0A1J1I925_9DIPT|nr:CLUMA_CG008420, isoform A [Clunio marinus]
MFREETPQFRRKIKKFIRMLTEEQDKKKALADYTPTKVESVFRKHRQETLNLNGWGYTDSIFLYDKGKLIFTGNRYPICNIPFNKARSKLLELYKSDVAKYKPYVNPVHKESDYPPKVENLEFCKELSDAKIEFSLDFEDRFLRCRGQATREFYILRFGKFKRIPDIVVWPKCHEDVEIVVKLANKYLSVIIPYGGGTNITLSVTYTKRDSGRFFISLDTSQMNRILWIDRVSMLACIESGIAGKDMEDALQAKGLTVGHEPDSLEFSTLGGWVATRSSGMKQQTYGNIEDIVTKISLVTSVGTLEKNFLVPRASIGPDYDHVIMGSEGTLGVITNVIVKVHPKPPVRRCGSIMFPDFQSGVNFMYEVSKFRTKPSSLRLVDNDHFQLGQALQQNKSIFGEIVDQFKKFGASFFLRYDMEKVSLATYLYEGEKEDADMIEDKIKDTAWKFWGIVAGQKYGERAYLMTYTICYIRDMFFDMGFLLDSIEPSVCWSKCWQMIQSIQRAWDEELERRKLFNMLAIRISQIYNDGVCVYLYYGIGPTTEKDQLETFEELTTIIRDVIKVSGGSLSHHHGIGKKSSHGYVDAVSRVGTDMFHSIKKRLDPNNVFDAGNLVEDKTGAKL